MGTAVNRTVNDCVNANVNELVNGSVDAESVPLTIAGTRYGNTAYVLPFRGEYSPGSNPDQIRGFRSASNV